MSAHVQTNFGEVGAAGTAVSRTLTLTPGNAVLVTVMWDNGLGSLGTISQGAGDTLTQTADLNDSGTYQRQYLCHSVVGGSTTFTINWTNACKATIVVTEVSGLATASAWDVSASAAFGSGSSRPSGTTATLAQAEEFAYVSWHLDGSGATTLSNVSNGFTVPSNGALLSGATGIPFVVAYKVLSSTAAVDTTVTVADGIAGTGLISTFKDAVAALTVVGRTVLDYGPD